MDFADFIALPDSEKVYLVEINVGDQIDDETWTQNGGGANAWYLDYTVGAVNKVEENGTAYTRRYSITEVEANASSFYYDFENQRLYVHTSGSDDPGGGPYTLIVYVWFYFTNEAFTGNDAIIFPRQVETLVDGGLEVWNQSATDLVNWTETIAGASTVNREATEIHDGGYSVHLNIDAGRNQAQIHQSVILEPRGRCRVQVWYKHSAGGINSRLVIYDSAANVYLDSAGDWQAGWTAIVLPNATDWTLYELEFYAHRSYTNYVIALREGTLGGTHSVYYDLASLLLYREDNLYLPYINTSNLPAITQAVADYYTGGVTIQFGAIRFHDDGWWFPIINNYLWLNKEVIVRLGAKGSDFDDFEKIFTGRTEDHSISTTSVEVEITDERATLFREIPTDQYWVADYANLASGNEGKSIPILYGAKTNISPVEIDTAARRYKICGHQIQALSAVYDNGVLQVLGVDYNQNLALGEFWFLHAITGPITCDAQGKLCNWESGAYSNNVADILWDLIANENGIDEELIDFESFLDLKAGRTQQHALYIDDPQDTLEIIRLLQASALFHFIPLLDGRFGAFRFKTETSGLDTLYDEDFDYFKIDYESSVYQHVRIKYDEDPTSGDWLSVIRDEDDVSYKYKEEDTLTIETSLVVAAEAQTLGDWYLGTLENPPKKVETSIPTIGFDKIPSNRIILNKTRLDAEGNTVTICDEDVYSILELRKGLSTGRVELIGQDASQISELAHSDEHADTPHTDDHTDDHTDGAHTDEHTDDAHVDSHSDVAHVDIPHVDAHGDSHDDTHEDYTDGAHEDEHEDDHYDEHFDTSHTDTHTDSYTDTPHGDTHGDGHADSYIDEYEDIPHGDTHTDS